MKRASHREWVLETLERHEAALLQYALRLLGEPEQARDVVQHAFLKLCEQSADKLTGGERKWLFAVCRNRAFDILRLSSRKEERDGDAASSSRWQEIAGREPNPADVVAEDELSGILNDLLGELPSSQREALELWRLGFSNREIAELIERQEGHVRVLVHRALVSLRAHPQVKAWLGEGSRPTQREVAPAARQ